MAINDSPVINDDSTDYPEESVENKEDEIDDYLDYLEKAAKETSEISDGEDDYENEKPSEEISPIVDLDLPQGNILFSFV